MTFKFWFNVTKSILSSMLNLHQFRPEPIWDECRTFEITIFKCHNTSLWRCNERLLKSFGTFDILQWEFIPFQLLAAVLLQLVAGLSILLSFIYFCTPLHMGDVKVFDYWICDLKRKDYYFANSQLFIRSRNTYMRYINGNEDTMILGDINKMPGDDAIIRRSYFTH